MQTTANHRDNTCEMPSSLTSLHLLPPPPAGVIPQDSTAPWPAQSPKLPCLHFCMPTAHVISRGPQPCSWPGSCPHPLSLRPCTLLHLVPYCRPFTSYHTADRSPASVRPVPPAVLMRTHYMVHPPPSTTEPRRFSPAYHPCHAPLRRTSDQQASEHSRCVWDTATEDSRILFALPPAPCSRPKPPTLPGPATRIASTHDPIPPFRYIIPDTSKTQTCPETHRDAYTFHTPFSSRPPMHLRLPSPITQRVNSPFTRRDAQPGHFPPFLILILSPSAPRRK